LDIIGEVGVARIRARSQRLTAHLLELIDRHGFTTAASREPDRLAGTVALSVPDAQLVVRALKARDCLVDYRPPVGLRISPHFFNTEDEIDRLMAEVVEIVATKDYGPSDSPPSLVTEKTKERRCRVCVLVRDRELASHNGTCAREPAESRKIPDKGEYADKDRQFE
jgi:hypothetical protein